jgi:hypothetical protein
MGIELFQIALIQIMAQVKIFLQISHFDSSLTQGFFRLAGKPWNMLHYSVPLINRLHAASSLLSRLRLASSIRVLPLSVLSSRLID